MGTLGRNWGEITSQNVIAAQEATTKVAEGLSMWRGSRTPPRQGKGATKWTDGVKTDVTEN